MANMEMDYSEHKSGAAGLAWLYMPIVLILFLGGALSVGAYFFADTELTIAQSIAAGYGGLAALIIGLIGAAIGIVAGLIGALIGVVAAGGAVAMTLFLVASPVIAIILFVLLMRRPKGECPDPGAH
ncbi:MAG: hypothetical protein KDA46_10315 [Parvularculaceae bacterium]|nr:hypothetical protein [Parvularculaceae bacterium]